MLLQAAGLAFAHRNPPAQRRDGTSYFSKKNLLKPILCQFCTHQDEDIQHYTAILSSLQCIMVRHGVQQLLLVLLSIALATAAAAPSEPQVSYEGYQVFRIPIVNVENAHRLLDMVERLGVHLWRAPSRLDNAADVGVPLGLAAAFHRETADFGEPMVMHENLATLLLEEGPLLSYDGTEHERAYLFLTMLISSTANSSSSWYEAYHPWADHMKWLKDLSGKYASRSAIYNLGESGEKREMTGIHIWGQAKGKPAVVFFGTSHGREWIVAKSIEWIAEQLLAQYESNAKVKAVMDKYDVYIVPVVNPDGKQASNNINKNSSCTTRYHFSLLGFVYTQEKERMWRKNRTKHATNKCMGVDNNRNWPLGWGEKGSSKDPCSETFAGPSAVSEVENKNMIAFLEKVAREQKVKLFVDWHSYAQLVMSRKWPQSTKSLQQHAPTVYMFYKLTVPNLKRIRIQLR